MERSEERALRNEARFREANERIAERSDKLHAVAGPVPFLCECEEPDCTTIVRLSREEYAQVRSEPAQFVIAIGHPTRGDATGHRGDGWVCICKEDVGADLAREPESA